MPQFLKAQLYKEIKKQRGFDSSYFWDRFLYNIDLSEMAFDSQHLDSAVSVRALAPDDLSNFIDSFTQCRFLWVFAPVHAFREVNPNVNVFWGAEVVKVAGYRCLFHWVESDPDDYQNFFWANLFSPDIKGLRLTCARRLQVWVNTAKENRTYDFPKMYTAEISAENKKDEQVHPPPYLYYQLRANSVISLPESDPQNIRAVGDIYYQTRQKLLTQSKFKIGQRVELLDNLESTRLRPARIMKIRGRRVCVQVTPEECSERDPDDRQYGPESSFWIDEDSLFIFPVGWAQLNFYKNAGKSEYRRHVRKIADAMFNKQDPQYDIMDVRPEQMSHYGKSDTSEWQQGMKLELLDPLGATMSDLQVATVLDIKRDGYLIIGLDGPDIKQDSFPLHYTSPYIFPVGYAESHGIPLKTPEDEYDFSWKNYLRKTGAKAAPTYLFKEEPSPQRAALFKVGSKLEACDMCDNHMICPASIVGVKGRLLHVHFDGWADSYDQLFEIDTKDLFPLGWCEVHGYKLQQPKSDDD